MVHIVYNIYFDSKINLKDFYKYVNLVFEKNFIQNLYDYIKDMQDNLHIVFIDLDKFRSKYYPDITNIEFEGMIRALMYMGIIGKAGKYYVILPVMEKYL